MNRPHEEENQDRSHDPETSAPGPDDPAMAAPHARTDDPNAPITVAVGIVGVVLVFLLIVGLQALFYRWNDSETRSKTWAQAPEELARATAAQQEQIRSYRWVDANKGIAAIPIDRAMEIVVRELNGPDGGAVATSAMQQRAASRQAAGATASAAGEPGATGATP